MLIAAAAACKAVAIGIGHQPVQLVLGRPQTAVGSLARFALAGADRDAESFTAFIKEHSLAAVVQLIREGDRIGHLIDILLDVVDKAEPHIEANMAGDLIAARALADAARKIQSTNSTEAHEEKALLDAKS